MTLYLANVILGIETMKPHGTLGGTKHVITRISERWYEKAVESKNLACENFKVKLKEKSRGFYLLTS